MKTLRCKFSHRAQTSALFTVTTLLALTYWLSTGSGLATPNQCTFCHKRVTTMTLACTDLDYQRHLDHGDTVGACMTTTNKAASKIPSGQ